jgi:hypothetical protein
MELRISVLLADVPYLDVVAALNEKKDKLRFLA